MQQGYGTSKLEGFTPSCPPLQSFTFHRPVSSLNLPTTRRRVTLTIVCQHSKNASRGELREEAPCMILVSQHNKSAPRGELRQLKGGEL